MSAHSQGSHWSGAYVSLFVKLIHPIPDIVSRSSLRSAATNDIDVPGTRLHFGDRAFSVAFAKHWNDPPDDLCSVTDTAAFKKQLKAHFFHGCGSVAYLHCWLFYFYFVFCKQGYIKTDFVIIIINRFGLSYMLS